MLSFVFVNMFMGEIDISQVPKNTVASRIFKTEKVRYCAAGNTDKH